MRRKLRVVVAALLATLFVLSFAVGCAPTASLSIDPAEVSLTVGAQKSLKVKNGDTTLKNADLTWETGDPTIATVSEKGVVKGVAAGETTVKATASDGSFGEAKVTVTQAPTITVKKDGVAVTSATVERGQSITLTAETSTGGTVTWDENSPAISIAPSGNTVVVTGESKTEDSPALLYANMDGARSVQIEITVTFDSSSVSDYYKADNGGETEFLGEDHYNKWYYWYSQQFDWAQATVSVPTADFANGTATFVYSGNSGQFFGMQLFYNTPNTTPGKMYHLSFTMASTAAGQVTADNVVLDVQTGSHTYDVYYKQVENQASFRMMMGVDNGTNIQEATVKISNLNWQEIAALNTPATPTALTIDGKNITITDSNDAAHLSGYKLIFKQDGTTKYAQVFAGKTGTIDDAAFNDGEYDVHVQALGTFTSGKGDYGDSAESAKLATFTVANGGASYIPKNTGASGAKQEPGRWTYREEWAGAGFENLQVVNGVFSFRYKGGGNWDSYQLYFKNPANEEGKSYKITMKFTVSNPAVDAIPAGHKILISGVEHTLVEGENTFEATVAEGSDYSVQILFDTWHAPEDNPGYGGAGRLGACDFSITELTFAEDTSVPPVESEGVEVDPNNFNLGATVNDAASMQLMAGAEHTTGNDPDGTDNHPDTFIHWHVAGDWGCGAIVPSFSAEVQNDAVVVTYHGGDVEYSVQLFYACAQLTKGTTYILNIKVNVSRDYTIVVNGAHVNLTAGDNVLHIKFTLNADGAQNNGVSALDIQMPGTGTTDTNDVTFKFSDISWNEVLGTK